MAVKNSPTKGTTKPVKRSVGRPKLYTSVAVLEARIDEYFTYCDNRIRHIYDKKRGEVIEIIDPEPYTMSGLAYYLGIDRDTLLNYSKTEQFFGTVKKAKDRVHMDVEVRLMDGAGVGAIFSLKNNFNWVDQSQVDNTIHLPTPILGKVNVLSNNSDKQDLIPE